MTMEVGLYIYQIITVQSYENRGGVVGMLSSRVIAELNHENM